MKQLRSSGGAPLCAAAFVLVIAGASPVAHASDLPPPATTGIDGLCAALVPAVLPWMVGITAAEVQVEAEGGALDIAEELRDRCASALITAGAPIVQRSPAQGAMPDGSVQLRVRISASNLIAVAEVRSAHGLQSTEPLTVPLGAALQTWLSTGAHGLETWAAGSIDGQVLALCGAGIGGDDAVALVLPDRVVFARWTAVGILPAAKFELPTNLRSRARSPAASAVCRTDGGTLVVAFAFHDIGRGGVLRWAGAAPSSLEPLAEIPIGFGDDGKPVVAEPVPGSNTLRWKDRVFAQATVVHGKGADQIIGTTPEGALVDGDEVGRAASVGAGIAVVDLDHDGTPELVLTRPVIEPGTDAISVRERSSAGAVLFESRVLKELVGPVGVLSDPAGSLALAATTGSARSEILAIGQRVRTGKP